MRTQDMGAAGTSRVRAGDAERDAVVTSLRGHHEAGRLDAGEFQERMEAALGARWRDELPPLLADLPPERPAAPPEVATRRGGPPWGPRGPWPHAAVPVLVTVAVLGTVGALTAGHFPWVLVWLGLGVLWFRRWSGGRWHADRRHAGRWQADHWHADRWQQRYERERDLTGRG